MARWVPFLGLTAAVLTLLLGLARLSQSAVRDADFSADTTSENASRAARTGANVDTEPPPGLSEIGPPEPGPLGEEPEPSSVRERADPGEDGFPDSTPEPGPTGRGQPELGTGALLANVAITQGLFGGILVAGFFIFDIPASAIGITGDPWVTGVPAVLLGLVFGLLLWAGNEISATIADAVGAAYDEEVRRMLAPDSAGGWVVLLGLVLPVIAFVEEFIFRAAVIGATATGFGISPWALAVVSSLAFALGHGAQGRVGIVVTGTLGFVLAAGFIVSGSLLIVVIAHYAVNALEFVVHEGFGVERFPGA